MWHMQESSNIHFDVRPNLDHLAIKAPYSSGVLKSHESVQGHLSSLEGAARCFKRQYSAVTGETHEEAFGEERTARRETG
jgi:hypothetical protein